LSRLKNQNPLQLAQEIARESEKLTKKADTLQNAVKRFDPTPLTEFSQVIIAKRKELKMKSELVADLSGISRSAYQKIESGSSSPKLKTVQAICSTLGLTICVM